MSSEPQRPGSREVHGYTEGVFFFTLISLLSYLFVHFKTWSFKSISESTEFLTVSDDEKSSLNLVELCWQMLLILLFAVFLSSPLLEYGYHSDQQSLRLRRDPSRVSNQNQPQFDWSSPHEEEDEEGSSGPPRDLRATPLPMALKRAIR